MPTKFHGWGDAAIALCMEHLDDIPIETITGAGDAKVASCTVKRTGYPTAVTRTFSVDDAKKAGLWTKPGPWQTYPDRMLKMRARGFALRDTCSDCLMGLVLAEEAQDYPVPGGVIDVTASPAALPPAVSALERLPDEVRVGIEKAFDTLNLAAGARLAKLNEYLGDPESLDAGAAKLLEWCRDEFASRKGKTRAKGDGNGKKVEPAKEEVQRGNGPATEAGHSGTRADGGGGERASETPAAAQGSVMPAAPKADEIFKQEPSVKPANDVLGF